MKKRYFYCSKSPTATKITFTPAINIVQSGNWEKRLAKSYKIHHNHYTTSRFTTAKPTATKSTTANAKSTTTSKFTAAAKSTTANAKSTTTSKSYFIGVKDILILILLYFISIELSLPRAAPGQQVAQSVRVNHLRGVI